MDFLGGTVDRNLPENAGNMGLIPGPGKFHMSRSNEAHIPQLLEPECLCSATRETTAMRKPHSTPRSSPHLPQLEKACVQP